MTDSSPQPAVPGWTKVRRALVLLVAALIATLGALSVLTSREMSCSRNTAVEVATTGATQTDKTTVGSTAKQPGDETTTARAEESASSGPSDVRKETTTTSCDGVSTADLLPLVLLLVVLLLPDLSEFSVAGLVSLKKQVQQQQVAVDRQGERQAEVERHLLALQMSVSQSQQTSVVVNLDEVSRSIELKSQALTADVPAAAPVERRTAQALSPDAASKIVRLLELAEQLAEFERPGSELRLGDEEQQEAVRRWRSLFREELQVVRGVRNQLAHARLELLASSDIEEAIAIAERLRNLLYDGLDMHP